MKLPKKYLTKNPNIMKREIKKHADKKDNDSSAYGPWDADYKSGKAKKGKPVPTKSSKYTSKYKKMFGESESTSRIMDFDTFTSDTLDESSKMGKNSPVYKALKKKSDKSGFPLAILREVWSRGYAAWKTGHVPGTTPQQWAMARVNSFIVGGRTTEMSDKALYKKAKKNKKAKVNEQQFEPIKAASDTTRISKFDQIEGKNGLALNNLSKKYPCLLAKYRGIIDKLIGKGYDKKLLKAALGIIGRESSDASGLRYNIMNPLKQLGSLLGSDTSIGPAQMKMKTAKELGVSGESIATTEGAIIAVYKYIKRSYDIAKSKGYTNSPSVNFKNGTGDAALDMAIASYNLGIDKIDRYCETSDSGVKKSCSLAGKNSGGVLVSKSQVINYLPNYKTKRADKVEISTHGYVKEVADRIKKLGCF
jgi:hypothetical protein